MEQKYITIPFDLERAKRITSGIEPGKIVTRDGGSVRILCWDKKDLYYPIVGLGLLEDGTECMYKYTINGEYLIDSNNERDLILSVPEWATYKDGDIIYCEVDNGDSGVCKWVSILKGKVECSSGDLYTNEYATYIIDPNTYKGEMSFDGYSDNIDTIVLANEYQKRYLIESLKQSKDPKAKECLKRFFGIEENKECELKPFDRVLVRDYENQNWMPRFFEKYTNSKDYHFRCMNGSSWKYCVPYDGNENLLGTSNNPD